MLPEEIFCYSVITVDDWRKNDAQLLLGLLDFMILGKNDEAAVVAGFGDL